MKQRTPVIHLILCMKPICCFFSLLKSLRGKVPENVFLKSSSEQEEQEEQEEVLQPEGQLM